MMEVLSVLFWWEDMLVVSKRHEGDALYYFTSICFGG